jgi:hypothetical protein
LCDGLNDQPVLSGDKSEREARSRSVWCCKGLGDSTFAVPGPVGLRGGPLNRTARRAPLAALRLYGEHGVLQAWHWTLEMFPTGKQAPTN